MAHGKAAFNLKLYYANGHTCALNKEGKWRDDHLLIAADGLTENEPAGSRAGPTPAHPNCAAAKVIDRDFVGIAI